MTDYQQDHPRACGEHQTNLGNQQTMQGIIPAHAGNTALESSKISND